MRRLMTIIVIGLAAQCAQAADPVGRIFFTPEQRAQLDALRAKKAVASQTRDEPVPETITYNGIVRSSDGKTTVWINDEALSESALLNKQSIVGRVGRDGRITLQAPQAAVRLKVGQSATLFSGKVDESFTQGPESATQAKSGNASKPANSASAPSAAPMDKISVEEAAKIAPLDAATAAKLKAQAEALR